LGISGTVNYLSGDMTRVFGSVTNITGEINGLHGDVSAFTAMSLKLSAMQRTHRRLFQDFRQYFKIREIVRNLGDFANITATSQTFGVMSQTSAGVTILQICFQTQRRRHQHLWHCPQYLWRCFFCVWRHDELVATNGIRATAQRSTNFGKRGLARGQIQAPESTDFPALFST
jgi:hypothetical protein